MNVILLLLLLLTGLGIWEMARHAYYRRRLPIRVHVNGTRGKSSVTRLIAAGLRAGGIRTVAKTTGSAASYIHPDGSESPVRRRGGPNIREQLKVFRDAVTEGAEALVLECMAIRPDLQEVCEQRIVHAGVGVISNVRPDHLDVMGPRLEDVARSLAGTVPRSSRLVIGEGRFADYLTRRAGEVGTEAIVAGSDAVTPAELADFGYVEFAENVSLALATCEALGISRERALTGMREARPDIGALTRHRLGVAGARIDFINAFAANDPDSYLRIWQRLDLAASDSPVIVVFNVRADRQRRSKDLMPLLGRDLLAEYYVMIGDTNRQLTSRLRRHGIDPDRIVDLGGQPATDIWSRIISLTKDRVTVVGIGNIGGAGADLVAAMPGHTPVATEEAT